MATFFTSLALPVLLFSVFSAVLCKDEDVYRKAVEPQHLNNRDKRSDDVNPWENVVNQLAQRLTQAEAKIAALTDRTSNLENVVCFTVRFSNMDITGLGTGQTLVFNDVPYNVGNGYDRNTGIFTAPVSGTYVFALHLQRHGSDGDTAILHIKKGNELIAQAEAGYSPYEHGGTLVTTHLNAGEKVSVQIVHGSAVFGGFPTAFSGFRISP